MLSQLYSIAIANALLATLLAIVVWCISVWVRRPAVLHVLWVLVVVRLVMPPIFLVNATGTRDWLAASVRTSSDSAVSLSETPIGGQARLIAIARETLRRTNLLPSGDAIPARTQLEGDELAAATPSVWERRWEQFAQLQAYVGYAWPTLFYLACVLWVAGSASALLLLTVQVCIFRRRLPRMSYQSRIWQRRLEKVAQRMGLKTVPEILIVRATISPMLWGFGHRARVLFPERLLLRLNLKGQNTLLAHELAHYRRGDQWVRLLETLATIAFWWHQCCGGLVEKLSGPKKCAVTHGRSNSPMAVAARMPRLSCPRWIS